MGIHDSSTAGMRDGHEYRLLASASGMNSGLHSVHHHDVADLGLEAHITHPVSLIEHQYC